MLCQGTSIKSVFNFVTVAIQCVEVVCSGSEGCARAIQLTFKKCERANTGQMEDSVVRVDRLKSINTPNNTSRPKGAGSRRGVYCLGEQNISGLGGSTISSVAIAVPWLLVERQTAELRGPLHFQSEYSALPGPVWTNSNRGFAYICC